MPTPLKTALFVAALVVAALSLALGPRATSAQPSRLLPVDDPAYLYIERLQRRGLLLELPPTAPPYTERAVRTALDAVDMDALPPFMRRWATLVAARLAPASTAPERLTLRAGFNAAGTAATTERLDVLRPLGDDAVYSHAGLRFAAGAGVFVAQAGIQHDLYYREDPDGLSAVNRLIARSEDSYVGVAARYAGLYLGRIGQHWGLPEGEGVLLSRNARSFDQLHLRLGGGHLTLRSVLGELDNLSPDTTFTGRAFEPGSRRRYLAAHRLDWRPSPKLTLSFMESALYSSANSGVSLRYLNPAHLLFLEVDNNPKNDENNGFVAGLLWGQLGRWTLHGQLLLDDLDLQFGQEPTSFALTGSLHRALRAPADLGIRLTMVASRTYTALQTEGQYLYLLRGLGTNFSDYVHATAFADLYADGLLPGLTITPRLDVLAQGERDLRQRLRVGDAFGTLLIGTVERTIRSSVQVRLQPDPRWWVRFDIGLNHTRHPGHDASAPSETDLVGLVQAGVRLALTRSARLAL